MSRTPIFAACLVLLLVSAPAAYAAEKMFSYDPANEETRSHVDNGLTFVFDKNLLSFRMRKVFATQAPASATVEPADERDLGARLDRLLPVGSGERALYRIEEADEGPAMVRAMCPGSTHGWLVFGTPRAREDMTVHVLGDDPAGGKARLCTSLVLKFRGEWKAPQGSPRVPPAQPAFAPR